jgi:hypothetical protein
MLVSEVLHPRIADVAHSFFEIATVVANHHFEVVETLLCGTRYGGAYLVCPAKGGNADGNRGRSRHYRD